MTGIEQARKSSARASASCGFPTSVRSPQSTSASARCEISVNSSRRTGVRSSLTWRSPIAAKVSPLDFALISDLALISSLTTFTDIGKSPLIDGLLVVDLRQQAATADLPARRRQIELALQSVEQFVHQPARNMVALARVDPTKVENVLEQHLPMQIHVGEQSMPIDPIMLLEDEVGY